MSKIKIFLVFILMFVFSTNIFALCEDEELMSKINKFNIKIVEDEDKEIEISGVDTPVIQEAEYSYLLLFYPNTSDFVIKVSYDNEEEYASYSLKFGTYAIGSGTHYSPRKYKIEVFAAKGTACENERLLARYYDVPAFNEYSTSNYCTNHKEEEKCKVYFDSSKLTKEDKEDLPEEDEDKPTVEENLSFGEKIVRFIKKSWLFVIIPVLLITLIYTMMVVRHKKKEGNL